ncbi:MAG: substrate-binding domain-containing protein [Hespellia sp.]|nr:substrate-binding domain-containing protein [Hespellia sp.]
MKQRNVQQEEKKSRQLMRIGLSLLGFVIAGAIIYIGVQMIAGKKTATSPEAYRYHYVFLADDMDDLFWKEVCRETQEQAKKKDVYVEDLSQIYGENHDKAQLLEIATSMNVDGIIIQGDDSDKTKELIQKAQEKGIPVITALEDAPDSGRVSFIGVGDYNIGREYGREIIRIATKDTKKVLLLEEHTENQDLIYSGIQDVLRNEGNHLNLQIESMNSQTDTTFGLEEQVRIKLMSEEQRPDIIICTSEQDTLSVSHLIVDYNMVNQVRILGYYMSDQIFKGIQSGSISASVTIDTNALGKECVDTMEQYRKDGHTSDYVAMDAQTITRKNIEEYMKNDKTEK